MKGKIHFWLALLILWVLEIGLFLMEGDVYLLGSLFAFLPTVVVWIKPKAAYGILLVCYVMSTTQLIRVSPITSVFSLGGGWGIELISLSLLVLLLYPYRAEIIEKILKAFD